MTDDPGRARTALDALRGRIEETDHAILDLVARRAELARHAGDLKRSIGLPLVDESREREVERLMRERGRQLALPDAMIHALARTLIGIARAAQGASEAGSSDGERGTR